MAASHVSEDSDYDGQSGDEMYEDINDYYNDYDDAGEIDQDKQVDPEAFDFELLKVCIASYMWFVCTCTRSNISVL